MPEDPFDIEELDPRSFLLSGSLDVPSGVMLHELLDVLSRSAGDITLDLSRVSFMDSGGLRAVIQACMDLGDRGRLLLVNPSGQVRRLLDETHVEASCSNLRVVDVRTDHPSRRAGQ